MYYGFWFPENDFIKWNNFNDTIALEDSIRIIHKVYSQFSFFYFDKNSSQENWATIIYNSDDKIYTIGTDASENIITLKDTVKYKISKVNDSIIIVNNKKYIKNNNVIP